MRTRFRAGTGRRRTPLRGTLRRCLLLASLVVALRSGAVASPVESLCRSALPLSQALESFRAADGDPDRQGWAWSIELALECDGRAHEQLEALRPLIDDADPEVRARIICGLGHLGEQGEPVAAAVRAHLGDPEESVRVCAARSIGAIDPASASDLVAALADPSARVRETAAWRLASGTIPPEVAVSTLTSALADRRALVRAGATEALGRIGEAARSAAPELLELLEDPDISTRVGAAVALLDLGSAGDERIVPALGAGLSSPDPGVRVSALRALERLGPQASSLCTDLKEALRSGEVARRRSTADAAVRVCPDDAELAGILIVRLHGPYGAHEALGPLLETSADLTPAVPVLVELLEQEDPHEVTYLLRALERVGPAAAPAVPALVRILRKGGHEPTGSRAVGAAQALAAIGPAARDAVPALDAALNAEDPELRAAALGALTAIEGETPAALDGWIDALDSDDPEMRAEAARSLTMVGPGQARKALEALEGALDDPDPTVAVQAAAGVYEETEEIQRVLPVIEGLARSPVAEARGGALLLFELMDRADAARAAPTILPLIDDPDPRIRTGLLRLCGYLGDSARPIVPRIVEIAGGGAVGHERIAAIRALGALGVEEGRATLEALVGDEDLELSRAAVDALAALHRGGAFEAAPGTALPDRE